MMKPKVKNKIAFGEFLIETALDPERRKELLEHPELLDEFVEMRDGGKIVVHDDTVDVYNMALPSKEAIEETLAEIEAGRYSFPAEYGGSGQERLIPENDPLTAFKFRLGDYTLSRCR